MTFNKNLIFLILFIFFGCFQIKCIEDLYTRDYYEKILYEKEALTAAEKSFLMKNAQRYVDENIPLARTRTMLMVHNRLEALGIIRWSKTLILRLLNNFDLLFSDEPFSEELCKNTKSLMEDIDLNIDVKKNENDWIALRYFATLANEKQQKSFYNDEQRLSCIQDVNDFLVYNSNNENIEKALQIASKLDLANLNEINLRLIESLVGIKRDTFDVAKNKETREAFIELLQKAIVYIDESKVENIELFYRLLNISLKYSVVDINEILNIITINIPEFSKGFLALIKKLIDNENIVSNSIDLDTLDYFVLRIFSFINKPENYTEEIGNKILECFKILLSKSKPGKKSMSRLILKLLNPQLVKKFDNKVNKEAIKLQILFEKSIFNPQNKKQKSLSILFLKMIKCILEISQVDFINFKTPTKWDVYGGAISFEQKDNLVLLMVFADLIAYAIYDSGIKAPKEEEENIFSTWSEKFISLFKPNNPFNLLKFSESKNLVAEIFDLIYKETEPNIRNKDFIKAIKNFLS